MYMIGLTDLWNVVKGLGIGSTGAEGMGNEWGPGATNTSDGEWEWQMENRK